ncbi:MAG: molybdopterin cofactor-binding domain-containing protein [Bilophila wadsworthia]
MDPLELRAVNCYKPGDTNPSGQAPEVFSLPDMIDIMRPKFKAAKEKAAANSTDTVKRGVGVAIGIYGCGLDGPDSAESWAQYNEDGTVTIGVCWGDHGQGADAGALGTAHEALRPLNIAADRIRLVMNDTSKAPVGFGRRFPFAARGGQRHPRGL